MNVAFFEETHFSILSRLGFIFDCFSSTWDLGYYQIFFCPWEGDSGGDDDGRISGPGPAPSPHTQGVAKPCGQTPHSDQLLYFLGAFVLALATF